MHMHTNEAKKRQKRRKSIDDLKIAKVWRRFFRLQKAIYKRAAENITEATEINFHTVTARFRFVKPMKNGSNILSLENETLPPRLN